jgi:hypothetical protein
MDEEELVVRRNVCKTAALVTPESSMQDIKDALAQASQTVQAAAVSTQSV